MKYIFFIGSFTFLILSMFWMSCSEDDEVDCSLSDPGPNWFEIGFFNAEGNPLLGTEYTQESYRLFNAQEELFISPWTTGSPDYLLLDIRRLRMTESTISNCQKRIPTP